jgi:hypothetical protein
MKTVLATAAALLCLGSPVFAQQPAQPAPAPTLPPPTGAAQPAYPYPSGYPAGAAQPAYPYPPGYPYSPGYPYPPAYGYPTPYPNTPGYPPYPQQGYSPYGSPYPGYPPAYGQPPAAGYPPTVVAEPPPAPISSGRWRLGAALIFVPQGTMSYNIKYRGEVLPPAYSGSTSATVGFAAQLQVDLFRYLLVGFAVQYLPSLSWNNPSPQSSTGSNPYGGSAHEIDLLPQLGATIPVARRTRFLAFAAPGYSFLSASGLAITKIYVAPEGAMHGFLFQTGVGMIWSFGEHAFLDFRGAYQWGFQNNKVQSTTTGETADVEVHSRFFGLQAGGGYWF